MPIDPARYQRPDLPEEHLTAIGRVAVNAALVDSEIEQLIHSILGAHANPQGYSYTGSQRAAQLITAGMSASELIDRCRAMYLDDVVVPHGRTPERINEFHGLMREAAKLTGERNNIIHAHWVYLDDPSASGRAAFGWAVKRDQSSSDSIERPRMKITEPPRTAAEIDDVARRLRALADRLAAFHFAYMEEAYPAP